MGSGVRARALAWARLVDALDDVAARELVADALVEAPVFRVLVAAVVVVFFAAFFFHHGRKPRYPSLVALIAVFEGVEGRHGGDE